MARELLFSVTASDCKFDYFRCPGKGGQKVNKTSSGARCTHPPSGAVGQSCDTRSQHQNKRIAFERMANTKEYQLWNRREVSRITGEEDRIKRNVEQSMRKVRVEVKDENGRWTEVDKNAPLDKGRNQGENDE